MTHKLVIGTDEVGLGCIAGSLVAAAVVLPENKVFHGLRDSKKMRPGDREWVAEKIREEALGWVIAGASSKKIDRYGISPCRWYCMAMCVNECLRRFPKAQVIVDGNVTIAGIPRDLQKAVVKADDKYQAVSAASVIAKVHRDHLMTKLWERYPYYGWNRNAGYGTKEHLTALRKYGVTHHHRKSYGPVADQLRKK